MRTIKFRCLSDGKWEYATLEELCSNLGFDYGTPSNVISFVDGKHKTQWTGRLDKNGKEAYGSDIVKIALNGEDNEYCTRLIIWKFSGFYVEVTNGDYVPLHRYQFEVIGNIYENPDLITL